ncbi:ClpP/crotonase, partial [Rhizodiscina lignyota]
LRHLPTIFIAEINGRAAGSGNEFVVQCDMSFAGPDALISAPEVTSGGLAGNGGAQYVVRALGMQKAAEYLLTGSPVTGAQADQLGWVTRAFDSQAKLRNHVDDLATRMALLDPGALNITKVAIRAWGPSEDQIQQDLASTLRFLPT